MKLIKYECPTCGSKSFYVPIDEINAVYFYVTNEGVQPTARSKDADMTDIDFSNIRCFGCSWTGSKDELA